MPENPSTTTRAERREAARQAREEKERQAAVAGARRRRLIQLGVVLGVAVAAVVIAIAVSSGGGDDDASGGGFKGAAEVSATLDGIPQDGLVLGKADAPVTMIEFVDPQCPFCKAYALDEMPAFVERYVRTGKVKVELRTLSFIGEDSVKAAKLIQAAAEQDKAWNVSDLLYHNQGEENSGWVSDDLVSQALAAIPGLDAAKVRSDADGAAAQEGLGAANTAARRYGANETPGFVLGPTGGDLTLFTGDATAAALGARVDELAGTGA